MPVPGVNVPPLLVQLPDMVKVPLVELKMPPDTVKSNMPIGPEPAENVPDD